MMRTDDLYFGPRGDADVGFPLDVWKRAQEHLSIADEAMRVLAREHRLEFLENLESRIVWPARKLRKKRDRSTEIRLLLNPDYLRDRQMQYELHDQQVPGGLAGLSETGYSRAVATYTVEEMHDRERLTRDLETLIARLWP